MDFSKTKSIFILTFLILNIFLGHQLFEKRTSGDIGALSQSTLQEELNEWNIDVKINDSEETKYGSYITGTLTTFDAEYLQEELDRQTIYVNDYQIIAEMDDPYILADGNLPASVDAFLQQYVINGQEYEFSNYDEEQQIITLHQTYEGRPIDKYSPSRVHLVLYLNDDLEVIAYTQEYMAISPQGREQEMLTPMKAVEALLKEQLIPEGTVIDNARLGYNSEIQPTGEIQVFAPVWQIQVGEETYLVYAIDSVVRRVESE
ncbi:two-component system regulatory protein YycI [Bacillus shivajii]|uniref:two-component system regulatory protein YycI n=1 Tax=Bacillus shivajii TaxID=1983719 RepID=UPI001CFB6CA5|nr:two-component system regulatory protein YycI [Bacillus shivajii]UCZ53222.1 two-component system regulatory protein YycI [Bacillus shivajii]